MSGALKKGEVCVKAHIFQTKFFSPLPVTCTNPPFSGKVRGHWPECERKRKESLFHPTSAEYSTVLYYYNHSQCG
jgi:hypothetical protein